ncbi:MAG TPA: NADP-dependent oxidoreductase [Verrucomicrobiae bacterium]|nr:NADP-dependent oxidoreductase [Verrucomicrobiae bacterium]
MKAIQTDQYGGEEQLKMVEVAQPKAGKGQIVVRVLATSFNPIDVKRTSGNMKQVFPLQFPFVPGGDFSGVVDSVGEGVQQFKVGEEVYGYTPAGGAYAEYLAIDADKVAAKPKTLSHVDAAAVAMVAQTALQMLERGGVQKGQTVLIQGAGGAVGGIAVQAAHRRGAKVIATATGPSMQRVKDYGADEVIDYKAERFENRAKNVDVVLDTVGGDVQQRSFGVLKRGGVLVAITQPPSEEEAAKHQVKASMLLTEVNGEGLKKLAQIVDAGEIKPFVGKTFPLSEVAKGWEAARSGQVDGKIVFKVGTEASRSAGAE